MVCDLWFGGFPSVLCVSEFHGSLLMIVIMIDGCENRNSEGGFWSLEFAFLWKAQWNVTWSRAPNVIAYI